MQMDAFPLLMLWTAPALRHRSAIDWLRQSQRDSKEVRPGNDDGVPKVWRNWRGHDDVMQTRSIRGSGEPVWVNASLNACFRLGPDPRRALWPAASPSHKQAGHMTAPDQCCKNVRKFLPRRRRPHMTQSGHAQPRRLRWRAIVLAPAQGSHRSIKENQYPGTR